MEFGGTPAIGEVSGDEFGDFHCGARDVGDLVITEANVFVISRVESHGRGGVSCCHFSITRFYRAVITECQSEQKIFLQYLSIQPIPMLFL